MLQQMPGVVKDIIDNGYNPVTRYLGVEVERKKLLFWDRLCSGTSRMNDFSRGSRFYNRNDVILTLY